MYGTAGEGRKDMFYLTTHSTHFIYCYMASEGTAGEFQKCPSLTRFLNCHTESLFCSAAIKNKHLNIYCCCLYLFLWLCPRKVQARYPGHTHRLSGMTV